MVNPLHSLKRFTHPEPEIRDVSTDDPEIQARKQQHRINSRRAHFWSKVSQLSFWAMAATLTGGVFGAAASNVGLFASLGAMAGVPTLMIALGVGIALGTVSLVASNIENRIRVDNSLNFEEIHAKNIGKHTGEEVVKAMVTVVEEAKARRAKPAIPVAIARDTSIPQTQIATADASPQGTATITLPAGITLH